MRVICLNIRTLTANKRSGLVEDLTHSLLRWDKGIAGPEAPAPPNFPLFRYRGRGSRESMGVTPRWGRWTPGFPHLVRGDNERLSQRGWMSERFDKRITTPFGRYTPRTAGCHACSWAGFLEADRASCSWGCVYRPSVEACAARLAIVAIVVFIMSMTMLCSKD